MKAGDVVIYVPRHAKDMFDKCCEVGIVKMVQDEHNVFVNYWKHGQLQETAQRTSISDIKKYPFKVGDECVVSGETIDYDGDVVKLQIIYAQGEVIKVDVIINGINKHSYSYDYRNIRLSRSAKIKKILSD